MHKKDLILTEVSALLILFPASCYADNLGAIVYLLFIWPVGIILLILFLVMGIINSRRIRKKRFDKKGYRFGIISIIAGLVGLIIFPLMVFTDKNATMLCSLSLISTLPVCITALMPIISGALMVRGYPGDTGPG